MKNAHPLSALFLFPALCLMLMLLSGCGAEILTVTAVQGELAAQNAKSATKQLAYVKDKMGSVSFDQAVQAYRAEHGSNPPTLDALVPGYLPQIPVQPDGSPYYYDPATGTLSASAPAGASSKQDQEMMLAIRNAITRYGTATGYYPPTLDALYPNYMTRLPRTSAGQEFVYNNQNGQISLPGQVSPTAPARTAGNRSAGIGGTGPMGEVMTGIGIQQELGRMNTSGASAAGSRTRSSAQDFSNQHTNTQNRVMDQLGL
ncbi:MAG TPA: hypothetical protein PLZ53_06760 [Candidatus Hydrogenedentes bacterium]|jgi:hypothetical protein|nr:MAG: hypothetical protein BWY07_01050 [Candidatus Hydrogenedentes bacterium ADurb.Bin170]HNZ49318.1 hypothetical protein [Candidatus Hydrogenedentota bacterium]HOD94722.1 hypothetical protein [Candidatus Hydrogenedentota bacterium]HOH42801.1 hypothetical protein [Candidatus Hydrogenedentota bacterium]HOM48600.1 hypothetical protein [Candidatus Hydrogenedentota bacterium]